MFDRDFEVVCLSGVLTNSACPSLSYNYGPQNFPQNLHYPSNCPRKSVDLLNVATQIQSVNTNFNTTLHPCSANCVLLSILCFEFTCLVSFSLVKFKFKIVLRFGCFQPTNFMLVARCVRVFSFMNLLAHHGIFTL